MLHFVQSIFDEFGLSYIWQGQAFSGLKSVLLSRLDVILKSQFIQKWQSDINMSTKCANYRMLKVILYTYLILKKMNERITDS